MKICQIIYIGFGGPGSVAFSLVSADVGRMHGWMIGFIGDQPMDPSYQQLCAMHGVEWAEFRSTSGRPYSAWLRLARWLARMRPDAILLHSITCILPCRLAAWYCGARLIAVEHTSNAVKTRTEWMASRLSMLLADRIVVLTPEYREELAGAHGRLFRPRKVAIIPNGIDTTRFRPAERREHPTGIMRLGMAARFSFSKRQDLLVDMMQILVRDRPDVEWRLSLAGDGDRFEEVRRLIAARNLTGIVMLEGRLSENDVAIWLRGLDIYVHASDGETLSTSILQAMACGLPIIASDISGIRHQLGGIPPAGVLVEQTPEAFASAVADLPRQPEHAALLGVTARAQVLDGYSQYAMLAAYDGIIHREHAK